MLLVVLMLNVGNSSQIELSKGYVRPNRFNKTEAAIFPMQAMLLYDFPLFSD